MSDLERWWNPIPDDVKTQIRAMIEGEFNAPQVSHMKRHSDEANLRNEMDRRRMQAEILAKEAELKLASSEELNRERADQLQAARTVSIPAVKFPPIETVIDSTPSSPVAEWDAAGEKSDID